MEKTEIMTTANTKCVQTMLTDYYQLKLKAEEVGDTARANAIRDVIESIEKKTGIGCATCE